MSQSTEDQIRTLVGDTDTTELLTATEIQTFIDNRSMVDADGGTITNVAAAGADAAGAIAAKFAKGFTFGEDTQFFNLGERYEHYRTLEERLRRQAGGSSVHLSLVGTLPINA